MALAGWIVALILFFLLLDCHSSLQKEQKNHTPEVEKLLKDKLELEMKLLNAKLQKDFSKGNIEIKVLRIPFGNIIRSYKSNYVWVKQADLTNLQISDGMGTKTTLHSEIVIK